MDAKHNSFHTMTGSEHCRYTRRIIENIIKKNSQHEINKITTYRLIYNVVCIESCMLIHNIDGRVFKNDHNGGTITK